MTMKQNETKHPGAEPIPQELVERAGAGDQAAFAELYERTSPMVYRTIRSMIRDEDLAWDVQQNAYLRAWRGLAELQTPGAFLPWLRRIAVNEAARALEKRVPLTFTELEAGEEEPEPEIPDLRVEGQPELALDRKETARLVRELLASLPEQQQLVLGMRYYEEMPVRDIAALLGVSPGTVKTQLSRGRKRIEAGVRALEKQGVKLCGLSPLSFLLALLGKLEPAEAAGEKALTAVLSKAPTAGSAAAGAAAGSGAAAAGTATADAVAATGAATVKLTAMTAGQAFLHGIGAKLLAGGLAVALIGGSIWAGSRLLKERRPAPEELPVSTDVLPVPTRPTERIEISVSTEPSESGSVDAPVITMPAPSESTTEPPEPALRFETAEEAYDYVLEQYRQAAADPGFSPEAYPIVNAETISGLAERRARYADEDSALYASYYDLDGDGTEELIVSQRRSGVEYYEDYAGICAIYTWDGEVLSGVAFEQEDYVSVLADGTIRQAEYGYYRAPAPVIEYRLDPEARSLREQGRWSYACTEEGERSFTAEDGAVLTPAEFYARHGETVTLTKRDDEPFLTNPGTAEAPAVADLEGVPRESADRGPSLPRITLEGEAFEAFNERIRTQYLEPMQAYAAAHPGMFESWYWYGWSLNGDVLSVWIFDGTYPGLPPELVCRFSVSEARELTEDELLERFGLSRADYEEGMLTRLYGAFIRLNGDAAAGRGADQEIRWIYENREELSAGTCLLLDRSGRLVCLARVPSVDTDGAEYYGIPVLP